MNEYVHELESYKMLNDIAQEGGVVFFGSTFAKNIPVSELSQTLSLNCSIYNRSFNDLSVFDAMEIYDKGVLPLAPRKVLLQLGETDLSRGYRSVNEIVASYEELINHMKIYDKKLHIVIISVCSSDIDSTELNRQLEALAKKCKCQYADITSAVNNEKPAIKAFSMLKFFIKEKVTFYDAMNFC